MLKSLLSSLLFGFGFSQNSDKYYVGASYALDLTTINASVALTPVLVYTNPQGTEVKTTLTAVPPITVGVTSTKLEPIKTFGNVAGLVIPDNASGKISLQDSTNNEVNKVDVTIAQSIIITPQAADGPPIGKIGGKYTLNNVQVARTVFNDDFESATFVGYLVSVDLNAGTWMNLTTLPYDSTPSNTHKRRLLSHPKPVATKFYPNNGPDNVEVYTCTREGPGDYCTGSLAFDIPSDTVLGGPYVVNVMLVSAGSTSSNVYTVNGREKILSGASSFVEQQLITYSENSVDVMLKGTSLKNVTSVEYNYYDEGKLDIDITGLTTGTGVCMFVSLKNEQGSESIAQCGSRNASEISVLDWRFVPKSSVMEEDMGGNKTIAPGMYELELYLDPDCSKTINDNNMVQLSQSLTVNIREKTVTVNGTNTTQIEPAIRVQQNADTILVAGESPQVSIMSAIETGIEVEYYYESCSPDCRRANFTTDGKNEENKKVMISNNIQIEIAQSLQVTSDTETSNIVFIVPNICGTSNYILSRQSIMISAAAQPSDSSSGLGAGAIVGIVCAGVLVCGLAAWWMCMRKSQGDGYRQLDE